MSNFRISQMIQTIAPVKLMVVTKHRSGNDVRDAVAAGAKYLGENTLQEIKKKYDADFFRFLRKNLVELHFIGHLQSNKVPQIVRLCDAIQSVDSLRLLEKIHRTAQSLGKIMPVFLQVNFTGENQKYGLQPSHLETVIASMSGFSSLRLRGLMTLGKEGDEKVTREVFSKCQTMAKHFQLAEVSMGMSQDFSIALEEGATMIRIGSLLFASDQKQD